MKMHPGRILKAVFSLWDGIDRGATEEEVEFIKPFYQRAIEFTKTDSSAFHAHNIFSRVCSMIKYPQNYQDENLQ